jgi:hypothetical protein
MTKAEELINKHLDRLNANNIIGKDGNIYKGFLNAINEALTIPVVIVAKRTLCVCAEVHGTARNSENELVCKDCYEPLIA